MKQKNDDLLKLLGIEYEKMLADKKNYPQFLNDVQASKLADMYECMEKIAKDCGGSIEAPVIDYALGTGSIIAKMPVFDVTGEALYTLKKILYNVVSFSIDAFQDGMLDVQMVVPDVLVKESLDT